MGRSDFNMVQQEDNELRISKRKKEEKATIKRGAKIRDVGCAFRSPARLSLIGGTIFDETQFVPPFVSFFLSFYLRLLRGPSSSSRPILSVGISGRQQLHMLHSITLMDNV